MDAWLPQQTQEGTIVMMRFRMTLTAMMLAAMLVAPASAQYAGWQQSGSIFILTTPDGADLPAAMSVAGFPLHVRLNKDSFDFTKAQPHGEDVRFATSDGVELPYQIEEWDTARGEAVVWVRVPKIVGNARQELRVFWGHANAKSESSGAAVFNDANGYVSVWHLGDTIADEVGTLTSQDVGTTAVRGMIGNGRHLAGRQGIFCGEKIENYPSGGSAHSTEAWFRSERPNSTLIGWGNEGGGRGSKVRMQFRSPPHVHIDSDFSDVDAPERLPMREWVHVVHTYANGEGHIYINGKLAGSAMPTLNIKSPARLWLGGWYHNYDFVGDLDEVRVSNVARTADWIKLQFENTKPQQTLVGPIVQPGNEFSVSQTKLEVDEGQSVTVTAKAGGAQKVFWTSSFGDPRRADYSWVVATDQFTYTFKAGRVSRNEYRKLKFTAIYPNAVKSQEIAIKINEAIPEPDFKLIAPATWDGRQAIEVVAQIDNQAELQAKGVDNLQFKWSVDGVAVSKQIEPGKLILKRAQGSGKLKVDVMVSNGGGLWRGQPGGTTEIAITEPPPSKDVWVHRVPDQVEQPEDNQFFARDLHDRDGPREGTLYYRGTLDAAADSVFARVYADEQLFKTETSKLGAEKTYSLSVKLKPGLIKYRTEFGSKTGNQETVLHKASNLVCGDVFLINGQSNAVATDFGKENPLVASDWVRTFGATDGSPNGSRLKLWANAEARSPGGKSEIGYWGMELGRRLVESQKLPICIINGAVGGTRIDQHQRNPLDPTDAATIYGRLLWRVQQAKLTHGVRAIVWHQGENDQGADGPTGGYGYETYRDDFIDMAAAWKEDYPNVGRYYAFQIWPKACSMGVNGSDNKLREVQRTLPNYFSNLSVMSTLGVKPPGGCHFPAAGYAEFARLMDRMIEHQLYGRFLDAPPTPPNLKRAFFANDKRDELILEFDYAIVWQDSLTSQFYLDGESKQIASGSANHTRITLKLKSPSEASKVTYLDSAAWSPDNLLYGQNGLAALTFCDVPISDK